MTMATKRQATAPTGMVPQWTLEDLLMSPAGFGLDTATPTQRAICRIIEGLPLDDLADDPDVSTAVGGEAALAYLRSPPSRPREFYLVAAIRGAKSKTAAALAIDATQKVDISRAGLGEIARVSVLSVSLDQADVIFNYILEHVMDRPWLKRLLVDKPLSDSLMLRHPSGRPVEIKVVAGARAGNTLVARWSAGVIFDEAPRLQGDEGVVNFAASREAVLLRLLPGAQLIAIGSPWAPQGPIYEAVIHRHGKPGRDLVVMRATGPMLNPILWTPEVVARECAERPDLARTDILAEFGDPETAMYPSVEVERAVSGRTGTLLAQPRRSYLAAIDPATRGNAWTLLVGHEEEGKLVIDLAHQEIGSKAVPLDASVVLATMAAMLAPYAPGYIISDQYGFDFLRVLAQQKGLALVERRWGGAATIERYDALRRRLSVGALSLPPEPQLRADLLAVRRRLTAAGVAIHLPTSGDGRHCDYAPPLAHLSLEYLAPTTDEPTLPGARAEREPDEMDDDDEPGRRRHWSMAG